MGQDDTTADQRGDALPEKFPSTRAASTGERMRSAKKNLLRLIATRLCELRPSPSVPAWRSTRRGATPGCHASRSLRGCCCTSPGRRGNRQPKPLPNPGRRRPRPREALSKRVRAGQKWHPKGHPNAWEGLFCSGIRTESDRAKPLLDHTKRDEMGKPEMSRFGFQDRCLKPLGHPSIAATSST